MQQEVNAMLLQFRIKNYKSIGDEICIDLTAGRGRENAHFLFEQNGVKILPSLILYGANASGKSNIVDALTVALNNITSFRKTSETTADALTTPHIFNKGLKEQPTTVELFIVFDNIEYQYGYTVFKTVVESEWLYHRKFSKNITKVYPIFERSAADIIFFNNYANLSTYESFITSNSLAVSFFGELVTKDMSEMLRPFKMLFDWAKRSVSLSDPRFLTSRDIPSFYNKFKDVKLLLVEFLREFDPLIEDVKIKKEENSSGDIIYETLTKHHGKWYPLEIESTGTRKLFDLYLALYSSFNIDQQTLVFDELDICLHPLIIRRILSMFHNKEINKMQSQLITTCHNLIAMNKRDLRRDQIWLVEKDNKGFTQTFSLSSFKKSKEDIRSDMSYGKNYLAGRFGAIPYVSTRGCK